MNSRLHATLKKFGAILTALAATCALLALTTSPSGAAEETLPRNTPVPEAPAVTTITVDSDASSDLSIQRRLEQLYRTVELDNVIVKVEGGVVDLSGEVVSRAAHEQALALAHRVQSVVDVRDRLEVSTSLKRRLVPAIGELAKKATGLVAMLPLFSIAALVLVLFWWLARWFAGSRIFDKLFQRNPFLRDLMRQVAHVGIFIIGLILALEIIDASGVLTTLLGAAGILGLALGFALRDTVENYIASLLLSLRQPFERDDHVVIEGFEGRVLRLTPRATSLMTLDGNHLRIPNARVYKAVILNYTRNPKRRFEFEVGVDAEQNLAEAQALAARILLEMSGVLDEPAPYCTVQALGDSNIVLKVFGWVDQRHADFQRVRSEAIRLLKRAFDESGIVMPEPIYNLKMQPSGAPTDTAVVARKELAPAGRGREGAEQEPAHALDIARTNDLDKQIAADRNNTHQEDLLSNHARKE